ncbi:MAG: hypothetical protein RML36_01085 [Anaerolineae bacterium]|nr:hypothetical protein [Anaerolineae bacterium]
MRGFWGANALLYQEAIAERGETTQVIENPKHPYVQLLIDLIPVPDPIQRWNTNLVLSFCMELIWKKLSCAMRIWRART